jgi:hypothetical protein
MEGRKEQRKKEEKKQRKNRTMEALQFPSG